MIDVITIGTATRDMFLKSELFKVVHDPAHLEKLGFPTGDAQCFALGGKIEIDEPIFATGGGATNAAVTFARQGFKTAALIKIGNDTAAEDIVRELKKEHVAPIVIKDKKKGTSCSTILIAPDGERTILNYRGASEDLRKSEVPFGKMKTRWLYIVPGKVPFEVIEAIMRRAKKEGTRVAINPSKYYIEKGPDQLRSIFKYADVVIMNREEGGYCTGLPYEKEEAIFKKLDEWIKGIVVMTDGPKGLAVSDGRTVYRAGIFENEIVVDRTGAGDAFGSGFIAGLMRGERNKKQKSEKWAPEDIEYAIRLGSANATAKIEGMGAKAHLLTKAQFKKNKRWNTLVIRRTNNS